jgi:hypothetical protein
LLCLGGVSLQEEALKKNQALMVIVFLLLTACARQSTPSVTMPTAEIVLSQPTNTPPPTATPIFTPTPKVTIDEGHPGLPLLVERGALFSTSGTCSVCHTRMLDDDGADVSIDTYWRSTMMANDARDPYWQASTVKEIITNPGLQSVIEDSCATCHMPMARFTAVNAGGETTIFNEAGFLNPENELHSLAIDGVSCSLCHQIRETDLGGPLSYSGSFVIDTELSTPDRIIFGPYTIEDDQADIMQGVSGFRPEQGLHLSDSGLCATCHTLYTPTVDASGEVVGEFPEQVPYLEWYYSDYRRAQPCQGCHMPEAKGGVKIATSSQILRSPFALHEFVGGNVYMLSILKTFAEELEVTASSEQFDATLARALDQLQTRTATISLENVRLSGQRLYAEVIVENQAGHKFPTGFPSRRAWIHFTIQDANGQVVFESGAYDSTGSIMGNDNDDDPTTNEQHYLAIVQPEQVQIYEAILQDTENRVTTTLIKAAQYRKDNRLLPSGFEKDAPYEDIAVRGAAREDEDFLGGGDRIEFIASVGDAQGPLSITVELLYQSIGYRWAENLRQHEAPEITRFLHYYESVPNLPVVIASASVDVGG